MNIEGPFRFSDVVDSNDRETCAHNNTRLERDGPVLREICVDCGTVVSVSVGR